MKSGTHDLLSTKGLGRLVRPDLISAALTGCLIGSGWFHCPPSAVCVVIPKSCYFQYSVISTATGAALFSVFSPGLSSKTPSNTEVFNYKLACI